MFGSIGGPELLVIFVVALLIFGPRKLPELGKTLGRGLAEFRRAANDLRDSLETEVARESPKPAAPSLPAGGSPPPGTLESGADASATPPTDDAAESRDQHEPR
ncbi:MAG TPA: twin-arginine translocase TatA/TatE family subunit [Candidatus Polarisedimenticolia bacterium]|nr:twin-arginine translocase TatA/TatE family subunit [Candidatus Polarisedimenticolia bacterium]